MPHAASPQPHTVPSSLTKKVLGSSPAPLPEMSLTLDAKLRSVEDVPLQSVRTTVTLPSLMRAAESPPELQSDTPFRAAMLVSSATAVALASVVVEPNLAETAFA